jgi:alcohol dehydrogenase class IV
MTSPGARCRQTSGLSEGEAAESAVEATVDLLDGIGVAHRLRDCGLTREQISEVADLSWGQCDDSLESNARPFGRVAVETILRDAF